MTEDRLAQELEALAAATPAGIPSDFAALRRVLALLPGASPTSPVGGPPPVLPDTSAQGTGDGSAVQVRDGSAAVSGASSAGATPPVVDVVETVSVVVSPPPVQQIVTSRIGMVPGIAIAPSSLPGSAISPGALNDITKFASTIRPPVVVDALPALPDPAYTAGSYAFLTTDGTLHKTVDGSAWSAAIGAGDIVAGSITAGQIAAGAIGVSQLEAGAVTADKLAATLLLASTLVAGAPAGSRVEMDTGGIRCFAADGTTLMAYLPTDGSAFYFNGSISATTLTSLGGVLAGVTYVPQASAISVSGSVIAPTTPPVLVTSIDHLALSVVPAGHGLCHDAAGDSGGATETYWIGADPTHDSVVAHEVRASDGLLLRMLSRHSVAAGAAKSYPSAGWSTSISANASGVDSIVGEAPGVATAPAPGDRITSIQLSTNPWTGRARPVVLGTIDGSLALLFEGADYTSGSAATNYAVDVVVPTGVTGVLFGLLIADATTTIGWQRAAGTPVTGVYDRAGDIVTTAPAGRFNVSGAGHVETATEGAMGRTVGIARQGSYVWTLDASGTLYRFSQSDLTFVDKFDLSSRIAGVSSRAGLFFDGTNLVITTTSTASGTGVVSLVKVTTAGAWSSTTTTTGLTLGNTATATVRGGHDDATNVWVAVVDASCTGAYAFNRGTGANVANRDFGLVGEIRSGVAWDGTVFRGMARGTAKVWKFTSWDWSTATATWWCVHTWRLASGPYETSIGAAASVSMGRRRKMSVTTGPIPYGADQCRVYLAMQAGSPTYAQVKLQTTDALTGRVLTSDAGGAAAPSSNSFPVSNPGAIGDSGNKWFLLGDGRSAFTIDGGLFSGSQSSMASGAETTLALTSNDRMSVPLLHFTTTGAITGTVAKTSGSTTIVGTGTTFTTQLSVGQVIYIGTTTPEFFIVSAITDNTHLTVSKAPTSSQSGQTCSRLTSCFAIPAGYAGWWHFAASLSGSNSGAGGIGVVFYRIADTKTLTRIGGGGGRAEASSTNMVHGVAEATLSEGDIVQVKFINNTAAAITPVLDYVSARRLSL